MSSVMRRIRVETVEEVDALKELINKDKKSRGHKLVLGTEILHEAVLMYSRKVRKGLKDDSK